MNRDDETPTHDNTPPADDSNESLAAESVSETDATSPHSAAEAEMTPATDTDAVADPDTIEHNG